MRGQWLNGVVWGEDLNMFHLRGRENSGQAEGQTLEGMRCKRGQWENGGLGGWRI